MSDYVGEISGKITCLRFLGLQTEVEKEKQNGKNSVIEKSREKQH